MEHRQAYTGALGGVGKKANKHFERAAELAAAQALEPEEFVARQMKQMAMRSLFWPQALVGAYGLGADDEPDTTYSVQATRYRIQLDDFIRQAKVIDPTTLLRSSTTDLTPLLRYALARQHGAQDLTDELRPSAGVEYRSSPVAREAFEHLEQELS